MTVKTKFRPQITRVELNPEQAVLACSCYNLGRNSKRLGLLFWTTGCNGKAHDSCTRTSSSSSSS